MWNGLQVSSMGQFRLANSHSLVENSWSIFCWNRHLLESTVGSFADQPSETNTGDEPWNGEKETMFLCRVKQCDVFSFSLWNI
jgi:hypothetical protein